MNNESMWSTENKKSKRDERTLGASVVEGSVVILLSIASGVEEFAATVVSDDSVVFPETEVVTASVVVVVFGAYGM